MSGRKHRSGSGKHHKRSSEEKSGEKRRRHSSKEVSEQAPSQDQPMEIPLPKIPIPIIPLRESIVEEEPKDLTMDDMRELCNADIADKAIRIVQGANRYFVSSIRTLLNEYVRSVEEERQKAQREPPVYDVSASLGKLGILGDQSTSDTEDAIMKNLAGLDSQSHESPAIEEEEKREPKKQTPKRKKEKPQLKVHVATEEEEAEDEAKSEPEIIAPIPEATRPPKPEEEALTFSDASPPSVNKASPVGFKRRTVWGGFGPMSDEEINSDNLDGLIG